MRDAVGVGVGGLLFVAVNVLVCRLEPHFIRVATHDRQFTAVRVLEYRDAPRPDVLLMGMSRVAVGLDPDVLEEEIAQAAGSRVRVLNLGIAAGTIDLQYLVLKNVIPADRQPAVIVYGLSEGELNSLLGGPSRSPASRLPYYALLLRPDDFRLYAGPALDDKVSFLLKQAVPLYRDRELVRDALSIQFNPDDPSHRFYAPGPEHWTPPPNGFRPIAHGTGTTADVEFARREYGSSLQQFAFSGPQADRLRDFIALAQARGIKVVLVNMPVTPLHRTFWGRPELVESYLRLVRGVAREFGVPLLDLYTAGDTSISPQYYFDTHHLDEVGAAILSRMLGREYLARMFAGSASLPPAPADMADFYRAELSDLRLPARWAAGRSYAATVHVRNASRSYWPGAGAASVRVAYHWRDRGGREVVHDGLRTRLPGLAPGDARTVRFTVESPPQAGEYVLEVDLVYEGVGWFGGHESPTLTRPLVIDDRP
jgi:hypothetical protein